MAHGRARFGRMRSRREIYIVLFVESLLCRGKKGILGFPIMLILVLQFTFIFNSVTFYFADRSNGFWQHFSEMQNFIWKISPSYYRFYDICPDSDGIFFPWYCVQNYGPTWNTIRRSIWLELYKKHFSQRGKCHLCGKSRWRLFPI